MCIYIYMGCIEVIHENAVAPQHELATMITIIVIITRTDTRRSDEAAGKGARAVAGPRNNGGKREARTRWNAWP